MALPLDSDANFRTLVESIRDYAIFMLDPQGRVATWNEGARRIKGYTAEEIIGKHFSTFYRPEDAARNVCEAELATAQREGRCEDYGWRVRKDGSQFWANVVITALRNREGELIGYAKVTRDMTDRAYRTFVELTHAIMWTTDANGSPNADSTTWRAFTGEPEGAWRTTDQFEAVHPDDRAALHEQWNAARAERRAFEADFRLRRHDGVFRWMSARAVPLLDGAGNVREWFGVLLDVSRRKAAERAHEEALFAERAARVEAERVQAELATTLGSIGDGVITTDAEGRVTFLNRVAERLTQWSSNDARGHLLTDIFPIVNEETRRPVPNPVEKVLQEGAIVGLANHTVLVCRNGTDLPIDDSAAPIRDVNGKLFGVVMVFRDVSAEKRGATRRAFLLRAGEALMSSADYRDSLSTIAHLAVPRLADWCAVDIVEPGATTPVQVALAHVDASRAAIARELARKYPPPPHATNGVAHVIRTGQLEFHKHIDEAMIEAAALNDEHRKLLQELMLRSAIIVPLRGRDRISGALTFVFAESGREYSEDDVAFVEELAERAGLVIERRRLEEEREHFLQREREAREHAEIANRSKDEFLATVSHELRNPLNTMLGWVKLLNAQELPEAIREPMKAIERGARTQARLIDDMLDVSRIISGKLRLHIAQSDITQIVYDAIESQRRIADVKGVDIVAHVDMGLQADADAVRVQQIVTNIIANAVKFTPRDGCVDVTATILGPTLHIRVADTGEGIDPQRLTAIFEPFRQEDASTTRRHGGLGLGLAIVRELVAAHGGFVRAESEGKGKGAVFVVDLPTHAAETTQAATSSAIQRRFVRLPGTRVLLVDDEPDALTLLRAVLETAGAQVTTAGSASTALEKLRSQPPDVLVSDIGMPDIDGYALMRSIRALPTEQGGRTPAIALTAYTRSHDAQGAFDAGFQRHIAKPVDPPAIIAAIANLLGLPLI